MNPLDRMESLIGRNALASDFAFDFDAHSGEPEANAYRLMGSKQSRKKSSVLNPGVSQRRESKILAQKIAQLVQEHSSKLSEVTRRNIECISELEKAAAAQRSPTDRIADAISKFAGSMMFVYIHLAWFGVWIAINSLPTTKAWSFDPYPFTFLTFVVSLEAIFLSTFILISQNHEEQIARLREHLDLQINLLAEQEGSEILRILNAIEDHLQIKRDPEAETLQEATQPQNVVSQINSMLESCKN